MSKRARLLPAGATALILTALGVLTLTSRRLPGPGADDVVRHGDARLVFPEGLTVDLGTVGPPRPGFVVKTLKLQVRNDGRSDFDLAHVRLATPCCTPASVSGTGMLVPGDIGSLYVELKVPVARPGASISEIPLGIASSDGDGQVSISFKILASFKVEDGVIAAWSVAELDFGKFCFASEPLSRDVEFIIQPAGSIPPKYSASTEPLHPGISPIIQGTSAGHGLMRQSADVISVRVTLDPKLLTDVEEKAELHMSGFPEHRLPLRWKLVPEVERYPAHDLLFHVDAAENSPAYVLFQNNLKQQLMLQTVESTLSWITAAQIDAPADGCVRLRIEGQPPPDAEEGELVVTVHTPDGREFVERIGIIPFRLKQ